MAEGSSAERIPRPTNPKYLKIPTPSPNGIADTPSVVASGNGGGSPVVALPQAPAVPADSVDLIKAVQAVFQAVTEKIAFHEREAARLRESLRPFAEFGMVAHPAETMEFASQEDLTAAVIQAASKLGGKGNA